MAQLSFFILTPAQGVSATAFNAPEAAEIDPRAVDGAAPGFAVNENAGALGVGVGDSVALTGKLVAPCRIIDDPAYSDGLKAYLKTLPSATLDPAVIFA